jgi:hypothetical protein
MSIVTFEVLEGLGKSRSDVQFSISIQTVVHTFSFYYFCVSVIELMC